MNILTDCKNNRPPRNVATDPEDAIQSFAIGGAAVAYDIWAFYTSHDGTVGKPKGKVWLEVEVWGADCYIRFSRTPVPGTTAANGAVVKVGFPRVFYVDPNVADIYLDALGTGAGLLKYRVCSSIGDRSRV